MKHVSWVLIPVVLLCCVFVVFRLFFLSTYPPGIFVDESSIALNAYTLLKQGTDEFGTSFPLYFKAFGDYKNPLFVYSVVPVIWIRGLSVESVRFTAALWGMAAVIIGTLVFWRIEKREVSAVTGALLLLTNPWLFQLARVAFEIASFPVFLFLASFALLSFLSAQPKYQERWLLLFSFSLAALFYSYTSGRLLAPLLLCTGFLFLTGKVKLFSVLKSGALFVLLLLPSLVWEVSNTGSLMARYSVVGLSLYTSTLSEFVSKFTQNYLSHFSFTFLFNGGDTYLRHSATEYSLFFLAVVPLFIVGVVDGVLKKKKRVACWSLLGFFLSPVPAALTIQSPHALRSVAMVGFVFILCAYGIGWCCEQRRIGRWILGIATLGIMVEAVFFLRSYTTTYARAARPWFDTGTLEALEFAQRQPGKIWISTDLYPGTYATADMVESVYHQDAYQNEFSRLGFFDPLSVWPQEGTIVLDNDACRSVSDGYTIRMRTDAACVVVRMKQ